jgi:hypothetical protein
VIETPSAASRLSSAWIACLLWASASACAPASTAPRTLSHRLTLPRNREGVFLNEDLLFYFSGEIDRASVTSESVRIRTRDGQAARGSLTIEGELLKFTPAPVLARDLKDGGYLPGAEYEVEIRGFPWLDGLRGVHGEPLDRTFHFGFKTVEVPEPRIGFVRVEAVPEKEKALTVFVRGWHGERLGTPLHFVRRPIEMHEPRAEIVFVDAAPEKQKALTFFPPALGGSELVYSIGSKDSIYLKCDKPLDPSSLAPDAFWLVDNKNQRISLRARLIENEAESRPRGKNRRAASVQIEAAWEREPRAALVELTPTSALERGLYALAFDVESKSGAPRDFSGHRVWTQALAARRINVGDRGPEAGSDVVYESFLDRRLRSPIAVPDVDGTAYWGETGRCEVRFPIAAGTGADGALVLTPESARVARDIHATRLDVAAGTLCQLPSEPGLVVLRSQGRLTLSGRLVREVSSVQADKSQILTARDASERGSLTLSDWLQRPLASGRSCTVLIAGGDLVIESGAELRVNTPLLLVAGGVVRVAGRVRGLKDYAFLLGDGGGLDIDPALSTADLLWMDTLRENDPNPLREELHLAVFSGPLPQRGVAESWRFALPRGSTGRGRWSLRYVRELPGAPASLSELGAVEDPRLLDHAGSIQWLIELRVPPGALWRPPFVDDVQLSWDPVRGKAGR